MSTHEPSDRDRILVVDDDDVTRVVIAGILRDHGYLVVEAGDGPSALAAYASSRPSLVVLDILMPGMDGFEVCRRMRRLPGGDTTPVLTLTGLDDEDSVHRAFEAGASDFSSKGGSWNLLTHRVRFLLRSSATLAALASSEARLSEAQRIGRIGNWELDVEAGDLRGSPVAMDVLGIDEPDGPVPVGSLLARVAPEDAGRLTEAFGGAGETPGRFEIEFRMGPAGPDQRCVAMVSAGSTKDDDGASVIRGTVQDITERWSAAKRIHRLAYYDDITGLPNRVLFMESLEKALVTAGRAGQRLGLLLVDLDDFKRINDNYGHGVGDEMLLAVGRRLHESIRGTDGLSRDPTFNDWVGRLGGDEFVMFLPELRITEDAGRVAGRLMESLSIPIVLRERELFASVSIGISLFPEDGSDAATLLQHADIALYHAKDLGKDRFSYFDRSMNEATQRRLALETGLRKAVADGEFELHIQPQLDGQTGSIVGGESLVRWRHPERGLVPPAQFISVAEESGLIVGIGRWVLDRALRAQHAAVELGAADLRIAVNLSAAQFNRADVLGDLERLIVETGADPFRIELELTESVLLEQGSAAQRILERAKQMGFRIAIDDFGTGYSSLGYLRMMPIDTLKIDKSFLSDIVESQQGRAIVGAIVALAGALGVDVVAEGVETEGQREALLDLGVRVMQGYLFGHPEPCERFLARIGAPSFVRANGETAGPDTPEAS